MKRLFFLCALIALFVNSALSQDHKEIIKQTAQLLLDATIKEDYSTVLDYTYPKLIEAHGGKDSVLNTIKEGFKKMKAQGIELAIKSGSLGDPGNEIKMGIIVYSVIPEKLILKINEANYITTGSLIGISSDNGDHWTFVDTAGLADLKTIIPDVNKLSIPNNTGPTLIKDIPPSH